MDLWTFQIPIPVALAIVATIGYIFGRRRASTSDDSAFRSRRELRRAQLVAAELEKIAWDLRKNLAKHHSSVNKFRDRVGKLSDEHQEATWKELCHEAEEILKPTLHLATQIANAYDEIRQQSANLMTFTEVRTDPLTGINNRRGMADAVANQFAMMHRYGTTFSLAILDVDHFKRVNDEKGHLFGDQMLQELARLFDEFARETDVVARYGGEEFVVVMPQTDLEGAAMFAERLRRKVEGQMSITVSGGVAQAAEGDTQDTLVARADGALYQAKSAGRNQIYFHDGRVATAVAAELAAVETEA
jgi:diguanylate cyclase (GGDEF)-like protein